MFVCVFLFEKVRKCHVFELFPQGDKHAVIQKPNQTVRVSARVKCLRVRNVRTSKKCARVILRMRVSTHV